MISDGGIVLDTNAITAISSDSSDALITLEEFSEIYIPLPAFAEALFGIESAIGRKSNLSRMRTRLEQFEILNMNRATAEHYSSIRMQLRQIGRPIPNNDIWIAALARQHGLPVMTRDKHFEYVDTIQVVSW